MRLLILTVAAASTCLGLGACSSSAPDRDEGLIPINGTRLFVHREGAGEPAIVIHGGPVLDHGYLQPYLEPLGDELELVFYDQRLSGRSDGVVDSASVRLDTFVDDIEALRQALGLERVHLIAHSWGGLLAMKYATAHPGQLRSLILLNPMPPTAALWRDEQRELAASVVPQDTAGAGALRTTEAFAAGEPAAIGALLRHSYRSQFRDRCLAEELAFHIGEDYLQRSLQFGLIIGGLTTFDLMEALREVDVPTPILYGEDEPGASIGGDAIAEAIPGAQRVTIPATGHFPFVEQPEAFLDAVRAFLAR